MNVINQFKTELNRTCGVYKLWFDGSESFYVGGTRQHFRARFSNHIKFFKSGKAINPKVLEELNAYGLESLRFEILEVCSKDECSEREQVWLDLLKPTLNFKHYSKNLSSTNLGKKFSKEHIEKIREKSKSYRHSTSSLAKVTALNKEGASKINLTNLETDEVLHFNSAIEVSHFFGNSWFPYHTEVYRGWKIEFLKSQKKKIALLVDNKWKEFQSFAQCDKFLDKWRGFTSSKIVLGETTLNDYPVQLLN